MIVFYDITDGSSFYDVGRWLYDIERYCPTTPQIIIVGTKLDLATTNREVEFSHAKQFADENGLQLWETSSKDGTNVEEAIMSLITSIKRIKCSDEDLPQQQLTPSSSSQSPTVQQSSFLGKLTHWF